MDPHSFSLMDPDGWFFFITFQQSSFLLIELGTLQQTLHKVFLQNLKVTPQFSKGASGSALRKTAGSTALPPVQF